MFQVFFRYLLCVLDELMRSGQLVVMVVSACSLGTIFFSFFFFRGGGKAAQERDFSIW